MSTMLTPAQIEMMSYEQIQKAIYDTENICNLLFKMGRFLEYTLVRQQTSLMRNYANVLSTRQALSIAEESWSTASTPPPPTEGQWMALMTLLEKFGLYPSENSGWHIGYLGYVLTINGTTRTRDIDQDYPGFRDAVRQLEAAQVKKSEVGTNE